MSKISTPQDRLPKQDGKVTVHGIDLAISREALSDWDVVECIAEVQDESTSEAQKLGLTVKLLKLVLGEDYDRVKETLRAENDGRLTIGTMSDFLTELFGALNPNS